MDIQAKHDLRKSIILFQIEKKSYKKEQKTDFSLTRLSEQLDGVLRPRIFA